MKRGDYAKLILKRVEPLKDSLKKEFFMPGRIPSFAVDDLLPEEIAREIYRHFPSLDAMIYKKSIRERKAIAAQMNRYSPLLEEIIYAFQDPAVVKLVSAITGLSTLIPDDKLYAGGISRMEMGDYLNPHLDNSHDMNRENYRILNLLYYVTPDWKEDFGGNLELWDQGPGKPGRVIHSRFNRLVVMATGEKSWHSVSPVTHAGGARTCVSNYFFSPVSLEGKDYFHVTSFRGRPGDTGADLILRGDGFLRKTVRCFFPKGVRKVTHVYQK